MKILVTGATGFIGKYVVKHLLSKDYEVIASGLETIEKSAFTGSKNPKYISYNINNQSDSNLYNYFGEPDVLIHLAWTGLPNYKQLFHFEENLMRDYFFIKNLIINGLKQVIVTGTCFEYGMQSGCLTETMPSQPTNPYGLAKDTLRRFLEQLQNIHPFVFQWVRLFYMYGEGQNPNSLISLLDKALNDNAEEFKMSGGEQLRDYLHVGTVGQIIAEIASQQKITGIINCCSGSPISVRKLVENYIYYKAKTINLKLGHYPYPDYEPFAFWGDNTKLKTIIDLK